jgi:hypothetical protein
MLNIVSFKRMSQAKATSFVKNLILLRIKLSYKSDVQGLTALPLSQCSLQVSA